MRFTEKCSILTGTAVEDDVALITVMNDGLAEQRVQHAIPLLYRHGAWTLAGEEKVLPWLAAGIANADRRSTESVIVGWAGQVLVVQDQRSYREAIQRRDGYVSIVRSIATIDDAIYAVGMRRQVHKRVGSGHWTEIDQGVAHHGDEFAIGFNAIDGFDADEIYAVGLNGEVWNRREGTWYEIHSPTNLHLHSLCCASNGNAYVGGRSGIFIRGRHQFWECLDLETDATIWGLRWFGDELYLILDSGIYQGTSSPLRKIEHGIAGGDDCHTFSSTENRLWCFGRKKITRYDGSSWTEVDCALPDSIDAEVMGFFNDEVLSTGSRYLEDAE